MKVDAETCAGLRYAWSTKFMSVRYASTAGFAVP